MIIYKGNIIFTKEQNTLSVFENGYIAVEEGIVRGVYSHMPEKYNSCELVDFGDKLIIPGFNDIHLHAPQFENMGIGLDKELLPWLNHYTFQEEAKFSDLEYAKNVYSKFVHELWESGTTRSIIFATKHKEATKLLMDIIIKSKLGAFVGKVNMDRNSIDTLIETKDESLQDTEEILIEYANKSKRVKPIITPRFVPSCTDELMEGLSELSEKYNVPVQSHLSENLGELELVRSLYPDTPVYAKVYDKFGLFGRTPTVMAHCIYTTPEEIELIKTNKVFVAHCPLSNFNLTSGIAPAKLYLSKGINIGLGSDIGAGNSMYMPHSIIAAIRASKMFYIYVNNKYGQLSLSEAFYMATKGGGSFFGKVGSFEEGFEFDALVIDDNNITAMKKLSVIERLEKYLYIGDAKYIVKRFVSGDEIKKPEL